MDGLEEKPAQEPLLGPMDGLSEAKKMLVCACSLLENGCGPFPSAAPAHLALTLAVPAAECTLGCRDRGRCLVPRGVSCSQGRTAQS